LKLLRIVIIDVPTFQVFFRQFFKSKREYVKELTEDKELTDLETTKASPGKKEGQK
jgi:hypothetical protein